MAYDQQTWALGLEGGTPLNSTRLNHMEAGIGEAHSLIADLALNNHTHVSADITDATSANSVNTIVKRDGTGFIAVTGVTGLSTATGSTQAVPKSQLDSAVAAKANTTYVDSQVATRAAAVHSHVIEDVASLQAELDGKSNLGHTHNEALDNYPIIVRHDGVTDPLRPATTKPVIWDVPDANRPATTGTTAGGAYAAVDNLDYLWTH